VNSGTRKAWKGDHGAYGFIVPDRKAAPELPRLHPQNLHRWRPKEAKGQACKTGDVGASQVDARLKSP